MPPKLPRHTPPKALVHSQRGLEDDHDNEAIGQEDGRRGGGSVERIRMTAQMLETVDDGACSAMHVFLKEVC